MNCYRLLKDDHETSHLTKSDAFGVNRDPSDFSSDKNQADNQIFWLNAMAFIKLFVI